MPQSRTSCVVGISCDSRWTSTWDTGCGISKTSLVSRAISTRTSTARCTKCLRTKNIADYLSIAFRGPRTGCTYNTIVFGGASIEIVSSFTSVASLSSWARCAGICWYTLSANCIWEMDNSEEKYKKEELIHRDLSLFKNHRLILTI